MKLKLTNTLAYATLAEYLDAVLSVTKKKFLFVSYYKLKTEFTRFYAFTKGKVYHKYAVYIQERIRQEAEIFVREAIENAKNMTCGEQLSLFRSFPYNEEELNALISILLDSKIIEIKQTNSSSRRKKKFSYVLTKEYINLRNKTI